MEWEIHLWVVKESDRYRQATQGEKWALNERFRTICMAVASRPQLFQLDLRVLDRSEANISSADGRRQLRFDDVVHAFDPHGKVCFHQQQGTEPFELQELKVIALALQEETERAFGYQVDDVILNAVVDCK